LHPGSTFSPSPPALLFSRRRSKTFLLFWYFFLRPLGFFLVFLFFFCFIDYYLHRSRSEPNGSVTVSLTATRFDSGPSFSWLLSIVPCIARFHHPEPTRPLIRSWPRPTPLLLREPNVTLSSSVTWAHFLFPSRPSLLFRALYYHSPLSHPPSSSPTVRFYPLRTFSLVLLHSLRVSWHTLPHQHPILLCLFHGYRLSLIHSDLVHPNRELFSDTRYNRSNSYLDEKFCNPVELNPCNRRTGQQQTSRHLALSQKGLTFLLTTHLTASYFLLLSPLLSTPALSALPCLPSYFSVPSNL